MTLSHAQSAALCRVIRQAVNDPVVIACTAVHRIVNTWGVEPRPGFVANELSVELADGVEVGLTSRDRRGIAIVRWHGEIVLHQCDARGHATYTPGAWEDVIADALRQIEGAAGLAHEIAHHRAKQLGGLVLKKAA